MSSLAGSSPHTRGAQSLRYLLTHHPRIIPAYAGSTKSTSIAPETYGDHPRIRGEHQDGPEIIVVEGGSSPHTRGARHPIGRSSSRSRIIPAYAGSTTRCSKSRWPKTDHPRIRGEHARVDPQGELSEGSSPHTRGARSIGVSGALDRRIIPAYAGSTGMRPVRAR